MDKPYERKDIIELSRTLADSFRRLVARPLGDAGDNLSPTDIAKYFWDAPFVLLAHDSAPDPVFTYANRKAQELFGYSWEEFIGLPSRLSAELVEQEDREQLLVEARSKGYIDNYHGVRIAKDGSRFAIEHVVLWNLSDENGNPVGQAAVFKHWRLLEGSHKS
jgi:PAS domain S-box-containing protein